MITVQKHLCPQNHPCPATHYCPVNAITQNSPFEAPKIDYEKCVDCGKCTMVCRVFQQAEQPAIN